MTQAIGNLPSKWERETEFFVLGFGPGCQEVGGVSQRMETVSFSNKLKQINAT